MAHILIVDDEARHCNSLREYLKQSGHQPSVAGSAERAFEIAASGPIDAILLDIRLPGLDGLAAISRLREQTGDAPIIVMTAFGTLDTAARAVREGVFEYLVKPFALQDLKAVLLRALQEADESPDADAGHVREMTEQEQVIGRSPVMQRVFNQVALVASSDVPVLLTGESGTGKEVVARAIHRYSRRAEQPFLPVLVAALSSGVIESELFGHAKGAYTGAEGSRSGLLEEAAGGTVLLDELGDIPLPLQVKLLRAIEERKVTRVGEETPRTIDARFIAATNRVLPDLIERGEFREDLYYRLSVYHIHLPPLRERTEDIPQLAHYFLQRMSPAVHGSGFSQAAMDELIARPWKGNIRELRNAVEHAAVASRGALIAPEHLPGQVAGPAATPGGSGSRADVVGELKSLLAEWTDERLSAIDPLGEKAELHRDLLGLVEPVLIETALRHCRENRAAASRVLGLDPKTLKAKLG